LFLYFSGSAYVLISNFITWYLFHGHGPHIILRALLPGELRALCQQHCFFINNSLSLLKMFSRVLDQPEPCCCGNSSNTHVGTMAMGKRCISKSHPQCGKVETAS